MVKDYAVWYSVVVEDKDDSAVLSKTTATTITMKLDETNHFKNWEFRYVPKGHTSFFDGEEEYVILAIQAIPPAEETAKPGIYGTLILEKVFEEDDINCVDFWKPIYSSFGYYEEAPYVITQYNWTYSRIVGTSTTTHNNVVGSVYRPNITECVDIAVSCGLLNYLYSKGLVIS